MEKIILHCDLNNYYASVECLRNPQYANVPMAVGGDKELRHGIILAKNPMAKALGIVTAEPIGKALKKCPGLILVPPKFPEYLRVSKAVRAIYARYTNQIEAFGIDECWLDVTDSRTLIGDGEYIANEIRHTIEREIGITASVGVSFNKIFAKLGSDYKKPDATTCITKDNFRRIVWPLYVGDLLYVGRSTRHKLAAIGINTIGDLANGNRALLKGTLGKWGITLMDYANGENHDIVVPMDYEDTIKGIGNSMTTCRDLVCESDVRLLISVLSESVAKRMRAHGMRGNTVKISIKDTDFNYMEKQQPMPYPCCTAREMGDAAWDLFLKTWDWHKNIRAIGVRMTNLCPMSRGLQTDLFVNDVIIHRQEILECTLDEIREKYGHLSIHKARLLCESDLVSPPIETGEKYRPIPFFG